MYFSWGYTLRQSRNGREWGSLFIKYGRFFYSMKFKKNNPPEIELVLHCLHQELVFFPSPCEILANGGDCEKTSRSQYKGQKLLSLPKVDLLWKREICLQASWAGPTSDSALQIGSFNIETVPSIKGFYGVLAYGCRGRYSLTPEDPR